MNKKNASHAIYTELVEKKTVKIIVMFSEHSSVWMKCADNGLHHVYVIEKAKQIQCQIIILFSSKLNRLQNCKQLKKK